jgi:hypothetical protein
MKVSPQQAIDFGSSHHQLLWVRKELVAIRGILGPGADD